MSLASVCYNFVMRENKLKILINKPIFDVFDFTIDPKNTNKWVDDITEEKTNEWPIKIGSIYANRRQAGQWNEYTVADYRQFEVFELVSQDKNLHVRYTYTPVKENITELEYYEWVDNGELKGPFTIEVLQKLKSVLENN